MDMKVKDRLSQLIPFWGSSFHFNFRVNCISKFLCCCLPLSDPLADPLRRCCQIVSQQGLNKGSMNLLARVGCNFAAKTDCRAAALFPAPKPKESFKAIFQR